MPDLSLDLRFLRYALVAAQQGSIRRAASVLDVQQSTLSRRIQLLEHRLGFSLFERDSRGIRLTSAGEKFLKEATIGVNHFDRAVQLAASTHRGERGELHIGVLATLASGFLQSLMRRHFQRHTGVKVSLHEGSAQENLHRLALGHLDILFVANWQQQSDYSAAELWSERIFVAVPEEHRLAQRDIIVWEDINRETFIVSRGGPGPDFRDHIVRRTATMGVVPAIDIHDVGHASLMGLVSVGYGVALTCGSEAEATVSGIAFRPLGGDEDLIQWKAVWSPRNSNPALRRLLELTRSMAKESAGKIRKRRLRNGFAGAAIWLLFPIATIFGAHVQMLGLWQ
ncbi:MAG: LysR family transcriptional regulator [Thiobacillus sp.]|nr:LysR family transcriptional regulator [Thiobacillus sp.]